MISTDRITGWRIWALVASGKFHNEFLAHLPNTDFSVACFGGMLFGWDIGAIGGIMVMKPFQIRYGLPTGSSKAEKKVTADLNANSRSKNELFPWGSC